jgi:hypothetical protein
MNWELIGFLNGVFAISVAFLWTRTGPKEVKKIRKGAIRHRHDEFEIEPADVPQFKPTCSNAPH